MSRKKNDETVEVHEIRPRLRLSPVAYYAILGDKAQQQRRTEGDVITAILEKHYRVVRDAQE